MRILMVTVGFPPAYAWGGPVRIVGEISQALVQNGHAVTVLCTNLLDKRRRINPQTFEQQVEGVHAIYFKTYNLPWWPGTLGPVWLPEMNLYLEREIEQFDVVHIHGTRNTMTLEAAKAAWKGGIPYLLQPHGDLPVIVNTRLLKRAYDRWLGGDVLKNASAVITLQPSEMSQALTRGVPAEKITIIPNGIDHSMPGELPPKGMFRERWGLKADLPLVLFLGRINKKKGTDMLVEAVARMRHQQAQLAIVGPDDGQLEEVRRLVEENHLAERVAFTGMLAGDNVYAAYQDADLFVLPCRTDTFPTTIMEACLAGTPMVVTEGCEMADLVRGRVAEVTPFDAGAFAQAMDRLLDDRELYERYHTNCRTLVEEDFSINAAVDKLEGLYAQVIRDYPALRGI